MQPLWETLSGSFRENTVEGLDPAAAGSSKSLQNMGSYCQATFFFLFWKRAKLASDNSKVVMPQEKVKWHAHRKMQFYKRPITNKEGSGEWFKSLPITLTYL